MTTRKNHFLFLITGLLVTGFLLTSFASFFVSRASLRQQIETSELPLTSDNVYSEIQRDLLRPVVISSLMAANTFLRDWLLKGEQDESEIRKYLAEIRNRYGMITAFLVSEKSHVYYHADGILKTVSPEEERDEWYWRVRDMEQPYELNVDRDMANQDAMTIFVNYRVLDYQGNFIGSTGVGLTTTKVSELVNSYKQKYGRSVFFTDTTGKIIDFQNQQRTDFTDLADMEGLSEFIPAILSQEATSFRYRRDGRTVHLNSRFIPELNWYLLVEQQEEAVLKHVVNALLANLIFCVVITVVVIILTNLIIKAYRKRFNELAEEDQRLRAVNLDQKEAINEQNQRLVQQNNELQAALAQVKKLSGFVPICASCKKIRDDQGFWNQIEIYIQEHSEAQFSHGLCPDCAEKLYPEEFKDKLHRPNQKKTTDE